MLNEQQAAFQQISELKNYSVSDARAACAISRNFRRSGDDDAAQIIFYNMNPENRAKGRK